MNLSKNIFKNKITAGCDEAGRGCLAGPVFAASVILPHDYQSELLNDSKQVSEKTRYGLRDEIKEKSLCWSVDFVSPSEIDDINILHASIKAMHRALDKLKIVPEAIIVDGNRFKSWNNIPFRCIVNGDARFANIAAASILAKTYRDEYMQKLHENFPEYNWYKNKGYPTQEHRSAIYEYGITPYHRRSFRLTDSQIKMKF